VERAAHEDWKRVIRLISLPLVRRPATADERHEIWLISIDDFEEEEFHDPDKAQFSGNYRGGCGDGGSQTIGWR
jgi:hypothetical protein